MLLRKLSFIFVCLYFKISNISCNEGSSLAFAIDDTRSMYDDIDQVRTEAKEIMNVVLTEKSSQIKDFVLVTINDPDVILRTVTSSPNTFQWHLDQIRPHNYYNEDCEEMSLTGIEKALKNSRPGSYIYVFTDASAKDFDKVNLIKTMCQNKQSQVVFVLTGDCNHITDQRYMVYHEIAAASSGQVFRVRKDQVRTVLETIKLMIRGKHTPIKWLMVPRTIIYVPIEFIVDEKADYAVISTSGKDVELQVTETRDRHRPKFETEKIMWNNNGKVLKVNNLRPGKYYAWVKGSSSISVVISARTDFTFEHGFSALEASSIKDTSKQPIAGMAQRLSIKIDDPEHSVDIKSIQILDMSGKVITQMPLRKTGDSFYITDAFVSTTQMFKIAVNGVSKESGQPITRISKTAIELQQPPPVPQTKPVIETVQEVKNVGYGSEITLTCRVFGHPEPKIEWFTKDGTPLASQSSVVTVNLAYVSYLKVNNIKKSDSYICKATNILGSRTNSTEVTVRPVFKEIYPTEVISAEYAKDVKIQCSINSYLPITIKWFHSGNKLSNTPEHTISADGTSLTLKSMDIGMDGQYSCEASLNADPTVKQTHLTVIKIPGVVRPVIETTSQNTHILTGDKIELSCKTIQGHPKPQVKWFKKTGYGFELLSGETNEILTVRSTDVTQVTKYKCMVENKLGKDSAEFEVIPETVPVVAIDEGTKINVNYGSPLSLTCRITARPAPTIEWFTNDGTPLPSVSSVIQVPSYISYLRLTNMKQNETYVCKATNKRGSTTSATKVNVPPVFSSRLPNVQSTVTTTTQHAEDVKIQCNIESYLPITIKWFHSGKELSSSPMHTISTDGTELTLKSIDVGMDGKYTCEASLDSDPTVKQAHVTVVTISGLARPLIETTNNRTKVMTGNQIELSCKTIQGHPKPQVKWFKKNGDRFQLLSRETNEILTVLSTDVTQVTKYKCVVVNKLGTDSAEFDVIPETVPVVAIDEGTKINVNYGSPLSLTCRITARPTPTIEWFTSDGTPLPSVSSVIEVPSYISYLRLTNMKRNETYVCKATNKRGSTTSATKVNVPPVFSSRLPNVQSTVTTTTQHAEDVKIQCNIESYLPITIKWFHSGKELSSSPMHTISTDGTELTLKSIDVGMDGKYTCEASLDSDSTVKQAHVTVVTISGLARPLIETTNNRTKVMTGNQIELSCKTIQGHPKPQVKWIKKNGDRFELLSRETNEILTILSTDVTQVTKYKCVVVNKLGTDSAEFEVIPESKPKVQNDEGDQLNISYGSQLSLTCRISARPAPTIEWFTSDGTRLPSQDSVIEVPLYISHLKLPNIRKSDTYFCKATNTRGSATSQTTVSVRPVFSNLSTTTVPQTAEYAKDVTMLCNITSYLPITIKWFHSGKELRNTPEHTISADGTSLTLNSMDIGMDGQYTCEASLNADPTVKQTHTTVVSITGLVRPVIGPTNKNIHVMKRSKIELICKTVQGRPKPQVKWYKKNNAEQFELLPRESSEVLTIPVAYFSNAGKYKCVAGNVQGTDTAEFDVTMSSLPEITIPETKRTFLYGSDAEITCKSEAFPSPSIVWMDEENNILENKVIQISEYQYISKLKLENMKKTGAYICLASNSIGKMSEHVNITVSSPFNIQEHIDETGNTEISYGNEGTLRCNIKSSHKMNIVWYKQNKGLKSSRAAIFSNNKYDISKDGTQMKIKYMDLNMVGRYTCEAYLLSDPKEKVTFSTNVKVTGISRPEITYSTTTLNDRNYTAVCRIKGVPKPTISWQFKPKGSDDFYDVPGSAEEFNIAQVSLMHSGAYKCVVKNALAETDQEFQLVVEEPPKITNDQKMFFGVEGDTVLKVPCNVTGFPDPVIVWKKEGNILNSGTKYTIKGNTLYINNPSRKPDSGNFTCVAKNKLGTAEETFVIDVEDKFDIEVHFNGDDNNMNVDESKATIAVIKCGIANSETSPVRWYMNNVLTNQTGITYIIERPTASDDANYTCRVNTEEGPKTENYILDVGSAPTFDNSKPPLITVDWSDDKELDCVEKSKPVAKIEWTHNGKQVESLNNKQVINVMDWGQYTCTVSNVYGTIRRSFKITTSGCYLKHHMTTQNMPLLTQVNTPSMIDSISNSDITLNKNDKVKLSCKTGNNLTNSFQLLPSKTEIIAECDTEDKFIFNGKTYRYKDLQCKTRVEPSVIKTSEQCSGPNTEMLRIGFPVNGFLDTYSVCYDRSINVPMYVHSHVVLTKSGNGVEASKFKWSPSLGLGDGNSTGGYTCGSSTKCCYEKGQLLNVDELPFSPAQGATFKDNINSIAIWNPCDEENRTSWQKFEKEIISLYGTLPSWTGTSNYVHKNGGLVPRYLWKIYDGESSVMVYVNDESPVPSDIKCTEPCDGMIETAETFLYCCTLEEFSKAFKVSTDEIMSL